MIKAMKDLPSGTVTFLFTDIEGSTKLLQKLGEEKFRGCLEEQARIIRGSISEHGGVELSTEGDAFFAVFDSAPHALASVVSAQRFLVNHQWPEGEAVKVRMGLHSGEGILGGDNYLGLDVHRAARIAAAGHGGQVLLSGAARGLVERSLPKEISLKDLGEHRLKDLAEPEHIYQLGIAGLPAEFPAIRSLDARPNNLPVQVTSFVGRDDELGEAKKLLLENRLLTFTGPGGTGKTRLALQVAAESLGDFGDGVFFVALGPVRDPALVPSTIAQVLGVAEDTDRSILESLKEWLVDKSLLLVLDNFEQIISAASSVSDLLGHTEGVKFLVTSREALHIYGEQEFQVPSLSLPDLKQLPPLEVLSQYDAVNLFLQRARAVDRGFSVTDQNAPAVAEISSRLDGLPLAIELAAARIKLLNPDQIVARMGDRLGLLKAGARDVPTRQQTLRDAIGWSYDLLNSPDQTLFRRLGIFVGGLTFESAEEVVGEGLEIDLLEGLSSLLDKSLLRQNRNEQSTGRFEMLETIRDFALEKLTEGQEISETGRRHAALFLKLSQDAEPNLMGQESAQWLERLSIEHDNLRAALRWCVERGEAQTGLHIGGSIWRFWHFRGHLQEGRDWFTRLLELPSASEPTLARAKGLFGLASLMYWQADYAGAETLYREAAEIFGKFEDFPNQAYTLYSIGTTYEMRGQNESSVEPYQAALALYQKVGDPLMVSFMKGALGWIHMWLGRLDEARPLMVEAINAMEKLGNQYEKANLILGLGYIQMKEEDYDTSEATTLEGVGIYHSLGDLSGVALGLDCLAEVALRREQGDRALRLAGAAAAMRDQIGGGVPLDAMHLRDPRDVLAGTLEVEAIGELWEEGKTMTLESALAYARRDQQ